MNIGFIIAGAFFIFNPFIGLVDVLPDFIGYIFIINGFSKAADIDIKTSEARRRMTNALYVSVGRFLVMIMSFFLKFDSTLVLVFAFSLAVLELMFVIPAFSSFFESVEYLQLRFSETAVLPKCDDLSKMTPIFIAVRSVGAVIPEFTSLVNEYGYVESGGGKTINLAVLKMLLTILLFSAALVFGIIWLSMITRYLKTVVKNRGFLDFISERYAVEIASDNVFMMKRSVKRFARIFFASLFFLIWIPFDSYYVIPEFAFGIIAFFAFRFAGKYAEKRKRTELLCLAFTAFSAVSYVLLIKYSSLFGDIIFPYKSSGFLMYYLPYVFFAAASYAVLCAVFYSEIKTVKNLINVCVGVGDIDDFRHKEANEERKKALKKKADRVFIVQAVFCVVGAVFATLFPFFETAWIFRMFLWLILSIMTNSVFSDVSEEAEKAL